MSSEDNSSLGESFSLSSLAWRSAIFFSLLTLLLYIGIHWPG